MEHNTIVSALLGVLEGLTEFIPVSSTGHVLLAGHFLRFDSPGRAFEVLIQLGAILAILGVYSGRLWQIFATASDNLRSRRFIFAVLVAFLPAALLGAMAHGLIKQVLFESPMLIAIMLILGGIVLLFADRLATNPRFLAAEDIPIRAALGIGAVQCLAMVPGVSRSGATIVGALALGASKRAAAEFSFFLSMPTMAGAFVFDLYVNRHVLDPAALGSVAIGFIAAFITAVFVVRWVLDYISAHGYAFFAWWRIVIGGVAMLGLFSFG